MNVLGIETSCDDTSVAVVRNGKEILSNIISSQDDFHRRFSGVVPEIASRKHLETIHPLIQKALEDAGLGWSDIDRIAVTHSPGLVGSLLVGLSTAKAYAYCCNVPLVPVNHMAAHLYAPGFENELRYPLLGLVVSGGHTLIVRAQSPVEYEILGTTIDDAVGEVYDKIAKYYELGYPGGPVIDRMAAEGNDRAFAFPRTMLDNAANRFNFSFSGIKTAVIHQTEQFRKEPSPAGREMADMLASFQTAVIDVLHDKVADAVQESGLRQVAVSGGVAANSRLRERFSATDSFDAVFPSRGLCMDNGAMVAGVGYHYPQEYTGHAMLKLDVVSRIVQRGKRRRQPC